MTDATAHRLLNELLGPHPAARDAAQLQLRADPTLLAALHPYLLARLADDPADRLRPALLIRELYRDNGPLLRFAVEALRSDAPDDDVREAVLELTTLAIPKLIIECAFTRPALFSLMFERSPRWVTRLLISEGRPGILTLRLLVAELPDPLLQQVAAVIADEAITSPHDLSPLIRPLSAVRLRPNARFEIGVALWRITWRVDPEFVTYLLEARAGWYQPQLLQSVALDMLATEPKLDEMVSRLLEPNSSVTRARPWIATVVRRVLGLGARGVKLLLAVDPDCGDGYMPFRAELLTAAAESDSLSRAFLPVALRVIESPCLHIPGADAPDGVRAACRIVADLGPAATDAVPKLLQLADTTGDFFDEISAAVVAAVTAREAVVATLWDFLRRSGNDQEAEEPGSAAHRRFTAFAVLLAAVNPAATAAGLVLDTDLRLAYRISERICTDAPPGLQRRWAEALMPFLAASESSSRNTAARMLADPLRQSEVAAAIWPWLVAAVALPLPNIPLVEAFHRLATSREQITAELLPLVTDTNRVVAANATAALAALNSVA